MLVSALTAIWLLPCAIQDWRTHQVSNWLTFTAIAVALVVRLIGWTQSPWWLIVLVTGLAIGLWQFDQLGGADAKGWIAFALMGERILLGAAVGMVAWFIFAKTSRYLPDIDKVTGYPGYFLGAMLVFGEEVMRY